jgi:uncharacterized protein (DUF736 family)
MDLKENQILVFKNKSKDKENQPDYRGSLNVNGQLFDLSLWARKAEKTGEVYLSGQIKEPFKKAEAETKQEQENDLPF